jgi:hypothetical protein
LAIWGFRTDKLAAALEESGILGFGGKDGNNWKCWKKLARLEESGKPAFSVCDRPVEL